MTFFCPWFFLLCRDENHCSKLWGFYFDFVLKGYFSCDNHKNYQRRRVYVESLSLKVKHDCRNLNWSLSLCTLDGHWKENFNFLTFCSEHWDLFFPRWMQDTTWLRKLEMQHQVYYYPIHSLGFRRSDDWKSLPSDNCSINLRQRQWWFQSGLLRASVRLINSSLLLVWISKAKQA